MMGKLTTSAFTHTYEHLHNCSVLMAKCKKSLKLGFGAKCYVLIKYTPSELSTVAVNEIMSELQIHSLTSLTIVLPQF